MLVVRGGALVCGCVFCVVVLFLFSSAGDTFQAMTPIAAPIQGESIHGRRCDIGACSGVQTQTTAPAPQNMNVHAQACSRVALYSVAAGSTAATAAALPPVNLLTTATMAEILGPQIVSSSFESCKA